MTKCFVITVVVIEIFQFVTRVPMWSQRGRYGWVWSPKGVMALHSTPLMQTDLASRIRQAWETLWVYLWLLPDGWSDTSHLPYTCGSVFQSYLLPDHGHSLCPQEWQHHAEVFGCCENCVHLIIQFQTPGSTRGKLRPSLQGLHQVRRGSTEVPEVWLVDSVSIRCNKEKKWEIWELLVVLIMVNREKEVALTSG